MTNLNVAHTILAQLGGGRFVAMTGAKNFIGGTNTLSFRLPSRFATDGINRVVIILDPSDTYTVQFQVVRGAATRLVSELSGIYADMLVAVFERATGLRTVLATGAR